MKTIAQIISELESTHSMSEARRFSTIRNIEYNTHKVSPGYALTEPIEPKTGDILQVGKTTYIFSSNGWHKQVKEAVLIEQLNHLSTLNNRLDISGQQRMLLIEGELASMRVDLRRRKRELEQELEEVHDSVEVSKALLRYINDPTITALIERGL